MNYIQTKQPTTTLRKALATLAALLVIAPFIIHSPVLAQGRSQDQRQPQHSDLMDKLIAIENRLMAIEGRLSDIETQLSDTLQPTVDDIWAEVRPKRVNLQAEMCFEVVPREWEFEKWANAKSKFEAAGDLGAFVYGLGAGLHSKLVNMEGRLQLKGATKAELDIDVCVSGPGQEFLPVPQTAASVPQTAAALQAATVPAGLEELVEALDASAALMADRFVPVAERLEVGPAQLTEKTQRVAMLLETFEMPSSPLAFLDRNFTRDQLLNLATLAPIDQDVRDILEDPGSLVPTDLKQFNICSPQFLFEIPPGSPLVGLRDQICGLNPIQFDQATATIGDIVALKGRVDAVDGFVRNTVNKNVQTAINKVNTVQNQVNDVKCAWDDHSSFFGLGGCGDGGWFGVLGAETSAVSSQAASDQTASATAAATAGMRVQDGDAVPTAYALRVNHPNPFRTTTNIGFDLPEEGPVTLTVYDLMGRRVATPVSEAFEAGTHRIVWDAGGLASGTYLYRLEAGSFVATETMQLVK